MDYEQFSPSGAKKPSETQLKEKKEKVSKNKVKQFLLKIKSVDKKRALDAIFLFAVIVTLVISFSIIKNLFISQDDDLSDISSFNGNQGRKQAFPDMDDSVVEDGDSGGDSTPEIIPEPPKESGKISSEELSEGIRLRVAKGVSLIFDLDFGDHEFFIDSINGNSVEVTIKSNPIFATLQLKEEQKFDLNIDGYFDLSVELLEIIGEEGLLAVKRINEANIIIPDELILDEPASNEPTSEYIFIIEEILPYSCLDEGITVDYSYLKLLKRDGEIIDEKKETISKDDTCTSISSYRDYFCGEDNVLDSKEVNCVSRYEDCNDGRCVVVRYEKNIGVSGSPDQDSSRINECHLKIGDTLFWVETSKQNCQDLFLSSKLFLKTEFLSFMEFLGFETSVIQDKIIYPYNTIISYSSTPEDSDDFAELNSKRDSDKCESINFMGVNLYCFNSVASTKNSNIESAIKLLIFSKKISYSYSSSYNDLAPFEFVLNKNIRYVDGTVSSIYEGDLSGQNSGCSPGSSTANYNKENIFLCEGLLEESPSREESVRYSSLLYREALEILNIPTEECYESSIMIPCTKYKDEVCQCCVDYGSHDETLFPDQIKRCDLYDDSDTDLECEISEKMEWNLWSCESLCNDWEDCTRTIPYQDYCPSPVFYANFNTLHGEYVNFLYEMSKNAKLSCADRRSFYFLGNAELAEFGCTNGVDSNYNPTSYPNC